MRVLFTSDLHGSEGHYEQLEAAIAREQPDILILGGDLFPDGNGTDPARAQAEYVTNVFVPRVTRWRATRNGLRVACICGNHDWIATWDALAEQDKAGALVLLQHSRVWSADGVDFLGYSHTPPTPFHVKDFERVDVPNGEMPLGQGCIWDRAGGRVQEVDLGAYYRAAGTIQADLASAAATRPGFVFVCHAPPWSSKLDRMRTVKEPTGSRAVRDFIMARAPSISLHGHIHESPEVTGSYTDHIGTALCVNPGQNSTYLHFVTFDTANPGGTLRHAVLK